MNNTFYLLRSLFGPRYRRRRKARRQAAMRKLGCFESLENRQLLAVTPLVTFSGVAPEGDGVQLDMTVSGIPDTVILGMSVEADAGSSLDPRAPRVEDSNGDRVPVRESEDDHNGSQDGYALLNIGAGDYSVIVRGEDNTSGRFTINVFMPGDQGGDGGVGQSDAQWTTAAFVQQQFGGNNISSRLFRMWGINRQIVLYNENADANANGVIDTFDYQQMTKNRHGGSVRVELRGDEDAPVIEARLSAETDSGRSDSDGITNDLDAEIVGSISDDSEIAAFTAQIDGGDAVDLGEILNQDFNIATDFSMNLDTLADIAGGVRDDLIDSGPHTLSLTAEDVMGNVTDVVEVTFEIDTIAPDAPDAPNLVADSDSGASDEDNITNDDTPTFDVDAEDGSLVRLIGNGETIGEATAASIVSITADERNDGDYQITATAEDVAGNVSAESDALSVTIDTVAPTAPTFDLAPGSDTGTTGDHLTEEQFVIFNGNTEADAVVTVNGSTATAVADGDGNFSVGDGVNDVELAFGSADYTVVATDAAGNTSDTTETFSFNSAPVVEDQTFGDFDEHSPAGTVIGTVAASDPNEADGDTLTFAIIGGDDDGAFTIDENTGEITVADPSVLDFEAFGGAAQLTVEVTDTGGDGAGGSGLTDTATITVNLNDIEPTIADSDLGAVDETAANGTVVGTVIATGDTSSVEYSLETDPTGGGFAIDGATGEITVFNTNLIDFETLASMVLVVEVSDDGGTTTSTANLTLDINDIKPIIADQTVGPVDEGALNGTVVGTVVNTGDTDPVTYTITSDASGGGFAIDNDGVITVADHTKVDFETASSVDLTVEASDDGGTTVVSATVTVTINDQGPIIDDQVMPTSISETAANDTVVGTVEIRGDAAQVTYSITNDPSGGGFAIHPDTGEITVLDTTDIDFEDGGSYVLTVLVDSGVPGQSDEGLVTVNIDDVKPAIADQSVGPVDESAPNGTSVGTVTVTGDTNSVDYSITGDTSGGGFLIDGASGEITVFNTDLIDFEDSATYTLIVEVTDDNSVTVDTATITINVNDVKPAIDDQALTGVDETAPDDTVVGTVQLTGDTNSVTYSITAGNDDGAFAIDGGTGEITVADTTQLDFEQDTERVLTVEVTDDAGTTTDDAQVTIPINDTEPVIDDQLLGDVSEDAAFGTSAGTVVVTGDTEPVNYQITNDPTGGGFLIDGNGTVRVADSSLIDFEQGATVDLTVQVDDGTPDPDDAIVTVGILDVDEPPEVEDQQFGTRINNGTNVVVDTIVASDPEGDDVTFTVTGGDGQPLFDVDPDTGVITAPDTSDTVLSIHVYTLLVDVAEAGGDNQVTSATITIDVRTNQNPTATDNEYPVSEDGTVAGDVVDEDTGDGVDNDPDGDTLTVTYDTTGTTGDVTGDDEGNFTYDPNGQFEGLPTGTNGQDTFDYTIDDGFGGTDTATVTITVIGQNDAPTAEDVTTTTDEDSDTGPVTFDGDDVDTDDGPGDLTYEILTEPKEGTVVYGSVVNNDDGTFTFDPGDDFQDLGEGEERTVQFSYRTTDSHGEHSDAATVQITVTGSNDDAQLAEIGDQTVLSGSPLHIPLNGIDPERDDLTFTFEKLSGDADIVASLPEQGSPSLRIVMEPSGNPEVSGEMIIKTFRNRVPDVVDEYIGLANAGTWDDDMPFHRIINGFMIQSGDPNGNGFNDEDLPEFDDQFHPDLQHNTPGTVSAAKTFFVDATGKGLDDTNSAQFFIIENTTRSLDFHHSIWGLLVEGGDVREAISNVDTDVNDRPTPLVVVDHVEVFQDTQNEVLMISVPNDVTSGTATFRVTVTDGHGNSTFRDFVVTVAPDVSNSLPFLTEIVDVDTGAVLDTLTTPVGTDLEFRLTAIDIEGDPFIFFANPPGNGASVTQPGETGVVTFTPPSSAQTIELMVWVEPQTFLTEHLQFMQGDDQRGWDVQWLEIEVTSA